MTCFSFPTLSSLLIFGVSCFSIGEAYYDSAYAPHNYTNSQTQNYTSQNNPNASYSTNYQNQSRQLNSSQYAQKQPENPINYNSNSPKYLVADEDRNDPGFKNNPNYSFRQYRRGNWDSNENWRYYRYAYLSGETQPEYYKNTHLQNRGGIGYDPDVTEVDPRSAFAIPDRQAAESYYYRARRGQAPNEDRYQARQDQYYQDNYAPSSNYNNSNNGRYNGRLDRY